MTHLIVTSNSLYKRNTIPTSMPDSSSIVGTVLKGYTFNGTLQESRHGQVPGGWYVDKDNNYYWGGGVAVQIPPPQAKSTQPPATIKGIDVSRYQAGIIDWQEVKNNNSFVYIKSTEGVNSIDSLCKTHAEGAKKVGLKIGYYHFGLVSKDSMEQAQHFDREIKALPAADLPPVLDIETNKANLSPVEMEAWINTFITNMNNLKYPTVMIYSCYSFLDANLPKNHLLGKHPLWLAEYTIKPAPAFMPKGWDTYTIWQYSEDGTISGMTDKVDLNRAISGFGGINN